MIVAVSSINNRFIVLWPALNRAGHLGNICIASLHNCAPLCSAVTSTNSVAPTYCSLARIKSGRPFGKCIFMYSIITQLCTSLQSQRLTQKKQSQYTYHTVSLCRKNRTSAPISVEWVGPDRKATPPEVRTHSV